MEIINASKIKKLNSQITCTSYYDFLTQQRQCLEALDCMYMLSVPPQETQMKNPLGPDKRKYFDVVDNATQWYLSTRALPVKNPLLSRQARQRRLKATSSSVPGRRVSPEFLSLLKQHNVTMREHSQRKCKRPKINLSFYKYDAEGKRRHMRPGIETAAPLEFPSPIKKDDQVNLERLIEGQEIVISQPTPLRYEEETNRPKRNRNKGNRDKYMNATGLSFLQVDNLSFPSTTEKGRDNTSNPSVPKPPYWPEPPQVKPSTDPLTKAMPAIQSGRSRRSPLLSKYENSAFFKAIQSLSAKFRFRPKKHLGIASCKSSSHKKWTETNAYESEKNPTTTGEEESRLADREEENPDFSGNISGNSDPFPCEGPSCTLPVAGHHLKTNQSKSKKPNNSLVCRKMEKPRTNKVIRNSTQFSDIRPDDNKRTFPCEGPSCKITDSPSKRREMWKHQANTGIRNATPCSNFRQYDNKRPFPSEGPSYKRTDSPSKRREMEKQQANPGIPNATPRSDFRPDDSKRVFTSEGPSCKITDSPFKRREMGKHQANTGIRNVTPRSNFRQDDSKRTFPCEGPSCKITDSPSKRREMWKHQANTGIRNATPRSNFRPDDSKRPFPSDGPSWKKTDSPSKRREMEKPQANTGQRETCKCSTKKMNPEIAEKEMAERNDEKPNLDVNSPNVSERSFLFKEFTSVLNFSKSENSSNYEKMKKPRVTGNVDHSCGIKRCPVKPLLSRRLFNNVQVKKRGTISPRNCCPPIHLNLYRCPTKPIAIRCDPETKRCVYFPHSSGNEKTDFRRWLHSRPNSVRRKKNCAKTRKTRTTKKSHQSDTSCSCEPDPGRVRQREWMERQRAEGWQARGQSCICPFCSSVIPPFRGQEDYQRCCPHRKRWHCKPTCQENSPEQTSYAPTVTRQLSRHCGSKRMQGGVDFREDDDYIPGRNRDVPHSFSSSLSSESDSSQQVRYKTPRKWSTHTFCFD